MNADRLNAHAVKLQAGGVYRLRDGTTEVLRNWRDLPDTTFFGELYQWRYEAGSADGLCVNCQAEPHDKDIVAHADQHIDAEPLWRVTVWRRRGSVRYRLRIAGEYRSRLWARVVAALHAGFDSYAEVSDLAYSSPLSWDEAEAQREHSD